MAVIHYFSKGYTDKITSGRVGRELNQTGFEYPGA